MKCPKCGVWSRVLRTVDDKRSRECANGHRFGTVEVVRLARTKPFGKAAP